MKKIIKFQLILFVFALVSCADDVDGVKEFDGSLTSVEDFLSPKSVEAMKQLGFVINTGDTPPNIEGVYLVENPTLENTTVVPDYFIGKEFSDIKMTFKNQDDLQIDYESVQSIQNSVGNGSLISGDGDKFSIYLKLKSQIGDAEPADTALAISGTYTNDGIRDLVYITLMLDNKGNPGGVYIENNKGRLLEDKDGFSPKQ